MEVRIKKQYKKKASYKLKEERESKYIPDIYDQDCDADVDGKYYSTKGCPDCGGPLEEYDVGPGKMQLCKRCSYTRLDAKINRRDQLAFERMLAGHPDGHPKWQNIENDNNTPTELEFEYDQSKIKPIKFS